MLRLSFVAFLLFYTSFIANGWVRDGWQEAFWGVGWGMGDRYPWSLVNGDGVVAVGEVIMGETTLQC